MHGGLGVWGEFGGTRLTPPHPLLSLHRLVAPGQSISPAPGGHRRVQSGVARIVLLIAGAAMPPPPRSRPKRTSPPALPAKGFGRAGWHFYASCVQATPCPHVPHPGLC